MSYCTEFGRAVLKDAGKNTGELQEFGSSGTPFSWEDRELTRIDLSPYMTSY